VIAGLGVWLLARGVWRAAHAWRSTRRIAADWQRRARGLDGLGSGLPAYRIDDPFPTVAVVGILSPRLFLAERVLRECSTDEIAAMVAHECAHVSARDNLKRLLIRACPDVFAPAADLDRAWRAAAEEAADARAAATPSLRLDLAQALIRVARLAAPAAPMLASAFYLGGSIEHRVRRLIDPPPVEPRSRWAPLAWPGAVVVFVAAVIAAAPTLHALMEQAVRYLP
jgi:beta-lactamase regulating signal transducer with metallopeptidase domain